LLSSTDRPRPTVSKTPRSLAFTRHRLRLTPGRSILVKFGLFVFLVPRYDAQ
jgi:hypothetical protein